MNDLQMSCYLRSYVLKSLVITEATKLQFCSLNDKNQWFTGQWLFLLYSREEPKTGQQMLKLPECLSVLLGACASTAFKIRYSQER